MMDVEIVDRGVDSMKKKCRRSIKILKLAVSHRLKNAKRLVRQMKRRRKLKRLGRTGGRARGFDVDTATTAEYDSAADASPATDTSGNEPRRVERPRRSPADRGTRLLPMVHEASAAEICEADRLASADSSEDWLSMTDSDPDTAGEELYSVPNETNEELFSGMDDTNEELRSGADDADEGPRPHPRFVANKTKLRFFPAKNSACVFVMSSGDTISFLGKAGIQVLRGYVTALGYTIWKGVDIVPTYAPSVGHAMTITTCYVSSRYDASLGELLPLDHLSLDEGTERRLRNCLRDDSVVVAVHSLNDALSRSLVDHFHRLYVPKGGIRKARFDAAAKIRDCTFLFPKGATKLRIPPVWSAVVQQLKHHCFGEGKPLKVLICGGRNSGKSTLARFLINSLLQECGEILLLDCDPGQAEGTPAGCISLLKITEPFLGPPFTHLQQPYNSCFIGGPSPSNNPDHYVHCIRELYASYNATRSASRSSPLFINTMGWTKGLGLKLFIDTLLTVRPTHVVQLTRRQNVASRVWNFSPLTPEYVREEDGWLVSSKMEPALDHQLIQLSSVSLIKDKHDSAVHRDLSMLAYFARLRKPHVDAPFYINSYPPYRIPWSSVGVCVIHETVPFSQILYALNGMLVALGICDPSLFEESSDPTLPKFLRQLPVCECVGYGIVRGICAIEKVFYIITPVNDDGLLSKINVLMRGWVNLPERIVHSQKVDGKLPYAVQMKPEKTTFEGKTVRGRSFREQCSARKRC